MATVRAILEVKKVVQSFMGHNWLERVVGTAHGKYKDSFEEANQQLRDCVQDLQLGLSVEMWQPEDEQDEAADKSSICELLERILRQQEQAGEDVVCVQEAFGAFDDKFVRECGGIKACIKGELQLMRDSMRACHGGDGSASRTS